MKRILAMLLTMAMLATGMVMPAFAAEADVAALTDGEYEATVDGQMGPMTVKVVIAGGVIASVEVVSNNETPSFAGKALESIPAAIVAANSATVDTVSGATKTSNRIMSAVALCLEAAAAKETASLKDGEYEATVDGQMGPMTVKVVIAGGVIADVVVVSNNETPNFAGKALESIPAAIKAANSATVDAVSGATKTSNRIMNAVALCLEAAAAEETVALKDGEYEATVDGQMGPMTVKVVIAGGVIADVVVVSNNETPNFAGKALESIPAAIVAANSATVDTVSGATKTSNRIMNAVSLCLEEAGK